VGSVDDVVDDAVDVRTRLIYASLEDADLVRQLREAMTGVPAVIDLRDVPGPRPSEWSAEDPSYYLG
jgi:hypothetical protein